MHNLTQQSYIAGNWVTPKGSSFQAQDPANLEPLPKHHSCQSNEVEQALHAAASAFEAYSQTPNTARAEFLEAIAEEIESLGDQLLAVCNQETALGLPRLTGERGRTTGQIRAFAAIVKNSSWIQASIDTADAQRQPVPKPDLRKLLKPLGPVAVFGASNFPFAFGSIGGDTISALASGNPVVVKGHPSHPATNELFACAIDKAITKCGMPKGVFSLLQGNTVSLSIDLVEHTITQAVGFTGSLTAGRALMDAAARRTNPIPVFAEMGSVNPVFMTHNALLQSGENIAQNLANSVCMGTGQFCTSPGVVVIQKNPEFVNLVAKYMANNPRNLLLNEGIGKAFCQGVEQILQHPNVSWVNENSQQLDSSIQPPNIVLNTTAKQFLHSPELQHEVFGPATLIVECDNDQEFVKIAQTIDGNLTASIHTTDQDTALVKALVTKLEQKVGRIIFNGFPTGVEVCGSQNHGGPYPSSSIAASTSVGIDAIYRFVRFVSYQDTPHDLLPAELQDTNPLKIMRRVNGEFTTNPISS
ncbi:aldehyde dehydrogenase (NADP(+)) [Paraglaciecola aquimarina]|uniref:Aldehyde dehydrogenase (NADP(+)) n=1 Tax=Paraglaciecola algarum TaxID=3050085 RepID=A0ABS9D738_9ALTE|nr:aldehyde dehydrogenase (NADP(+)) [Paraglaciecola sp. G1-23]MCF2947486.1 aldehyde dehydrogenase (NADP(+)) [Paraglaciecola sp. G1-23]